MKNKLFLATLVAAVAMPVFVATVTEASTNSSVKLIDAASESS